MIYAPWGSHLTVKGGAVRPPLTPGPFRATMHKCRFGPFRPTTLRAGPHMQITVSNYTFAVSEPYEAGHVISAQEARVLNSARAKRLSRLLSYWAKGARASYETLCTKLADAEARFTWGSRPSRSSVQDEVEALQAEGRLHGEELQREAERRAATRIRVAQSALEELI